MNKEYWNPYLGGFVLGTMLFLTFAIASQGFGASGTFSRATSWLMVNIDKEWLNNEYISSYFRGGHNPLNNWTVIETIGILLGGFVSALFANRLMVKPDKAPKYSTIKRFLWAFLGGAIIMFATRLSRGCTSGQGLDGMATFSVGAWIFMFGAFASALILSPLFRKQWVDDSSKGEKDE